MNVDKKSSKDEQRIACIKAKQHVERFSYTSDTKITEIDDLTKSDYTIFYIEE